MSLDRDVRSHSPGIPPARRLPNAHRRPISEDGLPSLKGRSKHLKYAGPLLHDKRGDSYHLRWAVPVACSGPRHGVNKCGAVGTRRAWLFKAPLNPE